ncbi:hypothetical protein TD95_004512 [Thielaviopsis punctulata]|uniref:Chitin-binding type-4 domain-containing protein n=1 Tax=Thielaviopsis punctulata TaxID=72032 RepID=A0A0F4ZI14_9PEZI|nr:hypothetical protein TD95_004512 [Thielaviopsis punctulata]
MQSSLVSLLALAASAYAHGRVTSPAPRDIGPAFEKACGSAMFNQMEADPNGNIEGMLQNKAANFNPSVCHLELCKAYQFADNTANVHSFQPGEKVDFKVVIAAPHTGVANVSVVDTTSNSAIGQPLISFTNYASTKTGVAANNTDFSVTMPSDLPSTCSTAGNCVLQWYWFSQEAMQTYISCVDFTTGSGSNSTVGSGSDSGTGSSSSSGPTTLVTATAPAATSAVATSAAATSAAATSAAVTSAGGDDYATAPAATSAATSAPASSAPTSSCSRRRRAIRNSGRMYKTGN